jgi:sugar phosphate isomerase/epimerase
VKLLHLKDALPDGAMTDVGAGTLDFPAIIAAGRAAGVEHFFVEHDVPPKPYWPSVENSVNYLRALA